MQYVGTYGNQSKFHHFPVFQWHSSVLKIPATPHRQKRAKFGDAREVYFAQEHPPGRQRISNFIDTDEMKRLPDFLVSVQQALGND